MIETAKKWINEHKGFVNYFLISCFVTVLDIAVSFGLEKCLVLFFEADASKAALAGNAAGVITGFIVQYFLCTKKVYAGSNAKTLIIFFLTWLLSLGLAEGIIYVVRTLIFKDADGVVYFLVGKAFSIVIPFFFTYFLRKALIPSKPDEKNEEKNVQEGAGNE
jgi:hypothetical protein